MRDSVGTFRLEDVKKHKERRERGENENKREEKQNETSPLAENL